MMIKGLLVFIPFLTSLSLQAQWSFDSSACVKDNPGLYSIVISQKGKVTYQRYFNGHAANELYNNQSLTKSVMSLLIGIAIDKGFISSVDERIDRFFPFIDKDADPRKRLVTIGNIMNQASGLWHENLDSIPEYLSLANPSNYLLLQPMISDPGTVFHYNNAASHLLSVILTRATGMSTLDFAKKYLFGPLDINHVQWDKMRDGYYDGGGLLSVHLSTVDMNKVGNVILNEGMYHGKRIVSANWIHEIIAPSKAYDSPWGFHLSRYALCYYHFTFNGSTLTYGLGWGGQFLVVLPDKHLVITVNENPDNRGAVHQSVLFTSQIFPLIWKDLVTQP